MTRFHEPDHGLWQRSPPTRAATATAAGPTLHPDRPAPRGGTPDPGVSDEHPDRRSGSRGSRRSPPPARALVRIAARRQPGASLPAAGSRGASPPYQRRRPDRPDRSGSSRRVAAGARGSARGRSLGPFLAQRFKDPARHLRPRPPAVVCRLLEISQALAHDHPLDHRPRVHGIQQTSRPAGSRQAIVITKKGSTIKVVRCVLSIVGSAESRNEKLRARKARPARRERRRDREVWDEEEVRRRRLATRLRVRHAGSVDARADLLPQSGAQHELHGEKTGSCATAGRTDRSA